MTKIRRVLYHTTVRGVYGEGCQACIMRLSEGTHVPFCNPDPIVV
jgi:hypothetical protein